MNTIKINCSINQENKIFIGWYVTKDMCGNKLSNTLN